MRFISLDTRADQAYKSMTGVQMIDILCDAAAVVAASRKTKGEFEYLEHLELVTALFVIAERLGFTRAIALAEGLSMCCGDNE